MTTGLERSLTARLAAGNGPSPQRMPRKRNEEITGPYRELALRLRELAGSSSSRVIARLTGVNFSTIGNMLIGDRGNEESTVKIALYYGVNPNELLRLSELPTKPQYDLLHWTLNLPDEEPERTEAGKRLFEAWLRESGEELRRIRRNPVRANQEEKSGGCPDKTR
jgi:transcriptional regulator with XRE-family HTH domain